VTKVIRQKAASASCHPRWWRMQSSTAIAAQAHLLCVGTLQLAETYLSTYKYTYLYTAMTFNSTGGNGNRLSNHLDCPREINCKARHEHDTVGDQYASSFGKGPTAMFLPSTHCAYQQGHIAGGGRIFHGGQFNVTLTSQQHCTLLQQWRGDAVIDFFCCIHLSSDSQCFSIGQTASKLTPSP